jgi:parvulin-like peptidyl-prolyl isomerase
MMTAPQQMRLPLQLRMQWPLQLRAALARLTGRRALVLFIGLLGVAIGVAVFLMSDAPKVESDIIARVNGEPITGAEVQRLLGDPVMRQQLQQELDRRSSRGDLPGQSESQPQNSGSTANDRELERLAVRRLIMHRLLAQEATRRNLTVTDKELELARAAVQRRFKDADAYEAWRKKFGLDDAAFSQALRNEVLVGRAQVALLKDVRPSEAQVQAYYESRKAELKTADVVRLQVMAVPDRALAERLVAALKRGEDFGRLAARERHKGVRSIESEKSVGVGIDLLPIEVREAVNSLQVGQAHAPIKSGDEYLIIRLAERQRGHSKSLDEARPEIEQALMRATQRRHLAQWMSEQHRAAKIEMLGTNSAMTDQQTKASAASLSTWLPPTDSHR